MELSYYKFRGARALILMHETHLKSFYKTWKQACNAGVILPRTEDPDYESLNTLIVHVLRSAGNYMKWICKNLKLNDPEILPVPSKDDITEKAHNYIHHLIERWKLPLVNVEEKKFDQVFKSNWGVDYSIEAMLEHAVMHPMRHEFQLKELMSNYPNMKG